MTVELETIPPTILAKHPELAAISEAIAAHREGRAITAQCPTCDEILIVTDDAGIGSLWVTCGTLCTQFHLKYEAQTKAA